MDGLGLRIDCCSNNILKITVTSGFVDVIDGFHKS
jgi:hypothetical protein